MKNRQQTAAEHEEQEEEAFSYIFKFLQERVGTAVCTLLKNPLFQQAGRHSLIIYHSIICSVGEDFPSANASKS